MVTARLLTNCSITLRNINTNARENITRTRAKGNVGYFFRGPPCTYYIANGNYSALYRIFILFDNCRLSLPTDVRPREWARLCGLRQLSKPA